MSILSITPSSHKSRRAFDRRPMAQNHQDRPLRLRLRNAVVGSAGQQHARAPGLGSRVAASGGNRSVQARQIHFMAYSSIHTDKIKRSFLLACRNAFNFLIASSREQRAIHSTSYTDFRATALKTSTR